MCSDRTVGDSHNGNFITYKKPKAAFCFLSWNFKKQIFSQAESESYHLAQLDFSQKANKFSVIIQIYIPFYKSREVFQFST